MVYIWKILMYTVYYKNISPSLKRFPAALMSGELPLYGFLQFFSEISVQERREFLRSLLRCYAVQFT